MSDPRNLESDQHLRAAYEAARPHLEKAWLADCQKHGAIRPGAFWDYWYDLVRFHEDAARFGAQPLLSVSMTTRPMCGATHQ